MIPQGRDELGSGSTEDYLSGWLAHAKGRIRARTYQGYEGLIRLYALPAVGELPLKDVHPLHLQSLYSFLMNDRVPPISAGTVLNLHLVLTQAFGQAVGWGLLERSPTTGAQPPRPRRPEPAVVDTELTNRILAAARGQAIELPVAIAIATGMRRGEILGLRWKDLDEDFSVAHVRRTLQSIKSGPVFEDPKTRRSRRSVALPRFLYPYLANQLKDQARRRAELGERWQETDLVVDSGDGGAVSPVNFSSAWPRFLRRSGLPHVRFHDLRHGHATLMLIQGVHPQGGLRAPRALEHRDHARHLLSRAPRHASRSRTGLRRSLPDGLSLPSRNCNRVRLEARCRSLPSVYTEYIVRPCRSDTRSLAYWKSGPATGTS